MKLLKMLSLYLIFGLIFSLILSADGGINLLLAGISSTTGYLVLLIYTTVLWLPILLFTIFSAETYLLPYAEIFFLVYLIIFVLIEFFILKSKKNKKYRKGF